MSAAESIGTAVPESADLRLDHVGIQVRDLEKAAQAFERLFGYRRATDPVVNTRQQTRGLFLEKPGSLPIKLITPLAPGAGDRFGLHHLAFITGDIRTSLELLRARGARVLTGPEAGEMFDDELIAFVFAAGINAELVSTDRWRGRLPTSGEDAG